MTAPYEDLIDQVADSVGVPRAVAQALVDTENSKRNPSIVVPDSRGGSLGLTQIEYRTASEDLGFDGTPAQLLDPPTNVLYGLRYLRKMYDEYAGQDWIKARAAYNAGPDMSPWPTADISRFQRNLARWIPIKQGAPPAAGPPSPPTQAAAGGASWLSLLVILGALLPWLFNLVKGKRR